MKIEHRYNLQTKEMLYVGNRIELAVIRGSGWVQNPGPGALWMGAAAPKN